MGLSVAKILAQKGANVAIIARDRVKLTHALTELEVRLSSRPPFSTEQIR